MRKSYYKYSPPEAVLANPESVKHLYESIKFAGGYDPSTNKFTPLKLDDKDVGHGLGQERPYIPASSVFETIAAAMEAGIVDEEMWPSQLFADFASFEEFINALSSYEDCYKLQDPLWSALRNLVSYGSDMEEGFCTAADLANRFSEVLDKLPEQWG